MNDRSYPGTLAATLEGLCGDIDGDVGILRQVKRAVRDETGRCGIGAAERDRRAAFAVYEVVCEMFKVLVPGSYAWRNASDIRRTNTKNRFMHRHLGDPVTNKDDLAAWMVLGRHYQELILADDKISQSELL